MSINASHSKLVDSDLGQCDSVADGAAEAVESSLRDIQSHLELLTPALAEGLAPAIADWFDRLRDWDADLRSREMVVEHHTADLIARRRQLARDIRRQNRLHVTATASPSQVAELQLEQRIEALTEQNEQLASELAHITVQRSVNQSSDASATLSWEQRKALLYRQYESESPGDAQREDATAPQAAGGPQQDTAELRNQLAALQEALHHRNIEVAELRALLDNRSVTEGAVSQDEGLAMGAATFAKMFDGDELVREERARLKELQTEWEAKFRDLEIAASIERANLARQRRELERQNAELEEQLAHLQQDLRQESIVGPNQSRRWMAKLGLGD